MLATYPLPMANLASTYRNQGGWKEAEELEVRVMETFKRVLGEEHSDTLTSMANLASTYRSQGRWDAAEELSVQLMETRKKKLLDNGIVVRLLRLAMAPAFYSFQLNPAPSRSTVDASV